MRCWFGAYNIYIYIYILVGRNKLVSNRDQDGVYGKVGKRATIYKIKEKY